MNQPAYRISRLEPLVICCAINETYALPLAVMLRSAISNLGSDQRLDVYVVDDGVSEVYKNKILESTTEKAKIYWLTPDRSEFSGLPIWGRIPITTYDRLMIARLLPPSVSKAIWLDADILVLGDISELWNTNLGTNHALAVQDWLVSTVSSRFGIAQHDELGIEGDAEYFNAGVMVINVTLWREHDIGGRVIAYLKQHRDRVFFLDQEGLNAILAGKWGKIDPRWNWSPGASRQVNGGAGPDTGTCINLHSNLPGIIHFTGNLKPWNYNGGSAYHQLYFQYLDKTAWADWRPQKNWKGTIMSRYESSTIRRFFHPAERAVMRIRRKLSRRYITNSS